MKSVTCPIIFIDGGDSIQESQEFWDDACRDKIVDNDIIRIADWFERSTREQDPLNSLILLWIGFNGLYGKVTELSGQRFKNECEKLDFTIDKLITDEQAGIITNYSSVDINKLVSYKLMIRYGKEPASLNLGEELNKKPLCEKTIIKKTVRCIYGIRNQLFHSAPQPDMIIDQSLTAKEILFWIASICLKEFTKKS